MNAERGTMNKNNCFKFIVPRSYFLREFVDNDARDGGDDVAFCGVVCGEGDEDEARAVR
jgi:hypothetical protein